MQTNGFDEIEESAFPYKPPSIALATQFSWAYQDGLRVPARPLKRSMDVVLSAVLLVLASPLLLVLYSSYLVEGILTPENKGSWLYYYLGVSQGKIFKKYKFRIIKMSCIDKERAARHEWRAYRNEWNPQCRTVTGEFVKKFYLDEIPQLICIFNGSMSFVGPRPLSSEHYDRDIGQGNIARKLLPGGLLGLGHIKKGTLEMGNPQYEFEYLERYFNASDIELFRLDCQIIYHGLRLVLKGGGY